MARSFQVTVTGPGPIKLRLLRGQNIFLARLRNGSVAPRPQEFHVLGNERLGAVRV